MREPVHLPNGPGAAAILAAGVGSGAIGVLAFAADAYQAVGRAFDIWPPSGPLSGVTLAAIVVWLVVWLGLSRLWASREMGLARVNVAVFALLIVGLL